MREQKKDRTPAKGNGLNIGNQFKTGTTNLGNPKGLNNAIKRRRITVLKHTLVNGHITYLKVLEGLQSNFEGVHNEN
ncbi:hypothetical protein [Gracilimonas mengyeensis]|uniref:Uncharacterized protein n=1 Tax=Gracilimonas mengyeensis TaxID=1302730 RepID=A0A521F4D6_9BACT|nr:hypothetical protein [Gracilimonas mengyeensis]SMO91014.1 hypothetical protein SAMN06265219_11525 [Gracilimonas mengyeensis]